MSWSYFWHSMGRSHYLLSLFLIATLLFYPLTRAEDRAVYGVVDCDWEKGLYDNTGKLLTPAHAAIHIVASDTESALRIQIIGEYDPKFSYYVDVLDMGMTKKLPGSSSDFGSQRILTSHGTTSLTNKELFDPDSHGQGVLRDIWTKQFLARYKPGVSSCIPYANALLQEGGPLGPNMKSSADFNALFKNYQAFAKTWDFVQLPQDNVGMRRRTFGATRDSPKKAIEYPIKTYALDNLIDPVDQSRYYAPENDATDDWNRSPPEDRRRIVNPFDEIQVDSDALKVSSTGALDGAKASTKQVLIARSRGIPTQVISVAKSAAGVAGVAGVALGAVFVILDFKNKNWVGAALGLAGLAIGIATIGLGGPVGWIVGGLITAFFAILPTLFSKPAKRPRNGNIAEAIQWAMFGDASVTGNEKCKEQNPNCTALYGPGVVALAFKWDYFDALSFLITANKGYAMSILDMADSIKGDGTANAYATMKCGSSGYNPSSFNAAAANEPDPNACYDPKFLWHGDLVTLPNLNQTADAIKKRIIDVAGNGDCKMDDPSGEAINYDSYGFSVHGPPVSIACNITAATNLNGVVVPLDKPTTDGASVGQTSANQTSSNSTTSGVLPGSDSTSGQNGGYIAPPANPAPFKVPFNSSNTICFKSSASTDPVCLPSGTYAPQGGSFGLKTSEIASITMPGGGCSIKLDHTIKYGGRYPGTKVVPAWLNDSITDLGTNADVKEAFSQLTIPANKGRTFQLSIPDSAPKVPPAVGFFSDTDYKGDVYWLSEGGGNLTDAQSKATKSARLVGGAIAYIFAGVGYGDKSEQRLLSDVTDLSGVKLADGDFSGKVKAVWVVGQGQGQAGNGEVQTEGQ